MDKLQYVKGATWDPYRACLPNTRQNLISDILSWINHPGKTNVLLLTGVAGAGKSTLAHSVAQRCDDDKRLITSFFFDREVSNRNNPDHLISTIAVDMCRANQSISNRIASAIKENESLAYGPISRQFDQLILQTCEDISDEHPWVIVLDALDEGCNADLLRILCEEASKLPSCFRFFITSRMYPELENLRELPRVRSIELETHGQDNMNDIAIFIPYRLKKVARHHKLDANWPGQDLMSLFQTRADGLFLWAATICDYLCTRSDPTRELRKLVSTSAATSSAEAKMDRLYITILQTCDWTDDAFVEDYHRLMGAAVATKTPLTLMALSRLYQNAPFASSLTLRQLSPLLTGLGEAELTSSQPVRFLHLSLRDFLTIRAKNSSDSDKFGIDEKTHSETLAYLCLCCINRMLDIGFPGAGYLTKEKFEVTNIPTVSPESVPEELWYACRFWIKHIVSFQDMPATPVLEQLDEFMTKNFARWVELVAACGRYEGISMLLQWLKVCTFL